MSDASVTIAADLIDALDAASEVASTQDPEPYQGVDRAWFRVTGPDTQTYYVLVSREAPEPNPRPVFGTPFREGDRVRSGAQGASYGRTGKVTIVRNGSPNKIYVHWDGDVMSSGYRLDSEVYAQLTRES